jgi:hypothetical protein
MIRVLKDFFLRTQRREFRRSERAERRRADRPIGYGYGIWR